MTKRMYFWAAIGLYVFGVIGVCVLAAMGLAEVGIPLTILGISSLIAAGVVLAKGPSLVDRRAGNGWLEAGLVLGVGCLVVIAFYLLLAAGFATSSH